MASPTSPSTTPPTTPRLGRTTAFWAFAAVLSAAYVAAFRWAWIDDAMITLTYARNLAEGAGFSLVPGVTHYGFTSPLNVLLLAGVGWVVGFDHAIATATAGLILLLLLGARRLSGLVFGDRAPGSALAVAIAASPLMASTFGLEVLLGAALSVFLLESWLRRDPRATGLLLGLLLLTRPDYGTVAILVLLIRPDSRFLIGSGPNAPPSPSRWRLMLHTLIWAAPLVALWHGFAWVALGSALPVTFLIKLAQQPWGGVHFGNGAWMYLEGSPLPAVGSLLPLLFLVGLARKWARGTETVRLGWAAFALGAAHFVGLLPLRVPPYHWYYVPSLTFLVISAWVGACCLAPSHRRRLALAFAIIGSTPIALLAMQRGLPFDEVPIHTNWATHRDYRGMANWLAEHTPAEDDVEIVGEIGTLAYYSRLRLLDHFSHPSAFPDLLHKAGHGAPTRRGRVKAINFLFHPGAAPLEPTWCLRGRQRRFDGGADVVRTWHFRARGGREATWTLSRCPKTERSAPPATEEQTHRPPQP